MKNIIIQLKKVTFAYPGNPTILEELDLAIKAGEFMVIFGPNGSAKTTLLKIILGLLTPQTGTVHIGNPQSAPPTLCYLPQKNVLNKSFPITIAEFLKLTTQQTNRQIQTILEKLEIPQKSQTLLGNLSGGQLQKIFLARILLANPQILFLDEPTNNLDQKSKEILFKILDSLHQEGKTILIITHDLEPVLRRASRFLLLEQKRIREIMPKNSRGV